MYETETDEHITTCYDSYSIDCMFQRRYQYLLVIKNTHDYNHRWAIHIVAQCGIEIISMKN